PAGMRWKRFSAQHKRRITMAGKSKQELEHTRRSLSATLADLRATVAQLSNEHASLTKERRELQSALQTIQEVEANIDAVVDGHAHKWADEYGRIIARSFSRRQEFNDHGSGATLRTRPPALPE